MAWNPDGSCPSARAIPAQCILHIGAHKTASTHLQKSLLAQRAALAVQGCAYLGPDLLRKTYALPSLIRSASVLWRKLARLRMDIAQEIARGQRIVLSDENIIGSPRPPDLALGTQLYPQAQLRVEKLIAGLELQDVTLCLALRDPLPFLASAWGHQFLALKPKEFDVFVADTVPLALRWSELADRLLKCKGVSHLVLWRFEDHAVIAPQVMALFGGSGAALPLLGSPHLVGPSARAIAHIGKLTETRPDLAARHVLRRALRRFPKSSDWPGPDPFGPALRAQSRTQYQDDWARLCHMPGVTCLQP